MHPDSHRKKNPKTKSKTRPKPKSLSSKSKKNRSQAKANNPDSPGKYSQDVREAMFIHWCRSRSAAATAKKFKCSVVTIHKFQKQDDWTDRFDKVLDQVRKKSEDKAATKISARVTTAKTILDVLGKAIVEAKSADIEPDARAWVKVAEYIDDQEGGMPVSQRSEILVHVVEGFADSGSADRRHTIANLLAGFGITDRSAIAKASKICDSSPHPSN